MFWYFDSIVTPALISETAGHRQILTVSKRFGQNDTNWTCFALRPFESKCTISTIYSPIRTRGRETPPHMLKKKDAFKVFRRIMGPPANLDWTMPWHHILHEFLHWKHPRARENEKIWENEHQLLQTHGRFGHARTLHMAFLDPDPWWPLDPLDGRVSWTSQWGS